MDSVTRTKIAFRKLKAHLYFDKTALVLRDKVVEFESNHDNFNTKIEEIAKAYEDASLDKNSLIMKEILKSISVLHFPKTMQVKTSDERSVVNIGNPKEKPIISTEQHFIDMSVEGHILGILWIKEFGKQLDKSCFKNARGNRIKQNLMWGDDAELIDSPALFEPYFSQYSLWRDDALSCAEQMLSEGHDTLILTLDLKSFYLDRLYLVRQKRRERW